MQPERPLQFPCISVSSPQIVDQLRKGKNALSGLNSLPEHFFLVILREIAVPIDELLRIGADLIDEMEGVLYVFIKIHR